MVALFIVVVSLCISALLASIINLRRLRKNLPPGPPTFPIIGNLLWLHKPVSQIEYILRRLKTLYGPVITLKIGRRSLIFVSSHSVAHQALIQNGAVFADRPDPPPTVRTVDNKAPKKEISSSPYGATWRLLRRNLTQEILHPSRVRVYSASRRWVLSLLVRRLTDAARLESSVRLIDHLQYAMFSLLVVMCFGDKLHESQIKEIESIQRRLIVGIRGRFNVLNLFPRLGKILFRNRWNELMQLRQQQDNILIPLIRARLRTKQLTKNDEIETLSYVDTLMDLQLPEEENRKLQEEEMVSLCSEFLDTGTDTTSTALQWIIANLVKQPQLQERLYEDITGVVGGRPPPVTVEEEDLGRMPYLKAVVLEGLRRHPPGHFVLHHKTTRDVELDGYMFPREAAVNFMVADMGWDPNVWEDPMEFKPERFFFHGGGHVGDFSSSLVFDITGSREIKMMPFGAGRRMCPASALAMLHLEYFVANLIWWFEWRNVEGDEVDLSEKQEFTIVMKNPLRAKISPRI